MPSTPTYGGDLFTPYHAWRVDDWDAERQTQHCKWCGLKRTNRNSYTLCTEKGVAS